MVEHVAWLGGKHTAHRLQQLEAAGVCHFNAVTTLDATSYFESIPPEHLSTVLWLESDRMGYAAEAVSEARVDGQRAAVANEARDHFDTMLAAVGPFGARALFPDWHPYAGLADNEDDLRHIHASDVLAFLRTWYSPANATLAIAGAFNCDATIAAVNRYSGSLPSTALPARPALREWTPSAVTLIVAAPLGYDSVTLAWRTPLYGTSDDAALDLATGALAGAANTRFADSLVSAGLATTISATQSSGLEASVFFVQARVAPGAESRARCHGHPRHDHRLRRFDGRRRSGPIARPAPRLDPHRTRDDLGPSGKAGRHGPDWRAHWARLRLGARPSRVESGPMQSVEPRRRGSPETTASRP